MTNVPALPFAYSSEELAQLTANVAQAEPGEHAALHVALAWGTRQGDPALASNTLARAYEVLEGMEDTPLRRHWLRRLGLVAAEAHWLGARLEQARAEANDLLEQALQAQDLLQAADAAFLLGWVAEDGGNRADADQCWAQAHALAGADNERSAMVLAVRARMAVLANPQHATLQWGKALATIADHSSPVVQMWVEDYHALLAVSQRQSADGVRHQVRVFELARQLGLLRMAIIATVNLAEAFSYLLEFGEAQEWAQRGLEIARRTGWPRTLAAALVHTAEWARRLGNHELAIGLLDEALEVLAVLPRARPLVMAHLYRAYALLDRHDAASALTHLLQADALSTALNHQSLHIDVLRTLAQTHLLLHDTSSALAAIEKAMIAAQRGGDIGSQAGLLQVLASICATHPEQTRHLGISARQCLEQAVALFDGAQADQVPEDLLRALAQALADEGAYAQAYETEVKARQQQESIARQRLSSRLVAFQAVQDLENARRESDRLRQALQAQSAREQLLQAQHDTLEKISHVGQRITRELDQESIFQVLWQHIPQLLPTTSFAVYWIEPEGDVLSLVFGMDQNGRLPQQRLPLDHPTAYSARCVRDRAEFVLDLIDSDHATHVPGTDYTLSALFAPLIEADRVMGAMSVQSTQPHAYQPLDRLIMRNLCAYLAIALSNAQTSQRLQQAQEQLQAEHRMAAIGSMVAGVAHELNTPLGNALTTASTLEERSKDIERRFSSGGLRKSELEAFLRDTHFATQLIQRSLDTASSLVSSFKQVAVDRTTEQCREFDLAETLEAIAATMRSTIERQGHRLHLEVPRGIRMISYPGPLGQVISNFVNNALLHAFDERPQGLMHLRAAAQSPLEVVLQFSDDGHGIAAADLPLIFDPFFTTKMGRGGTGLGLSISHNIVTKLLQGQISVVSVPGQGTRFELRLPVRVQT